MNMFGEINNSNVTVNTIILKNAKMIARRNGALPATTILLFQLIYTIYSYEYGLGHNKCVTSPLINDTQRAFGN